MATGDANNYALTTMVPTHVVATLVTKFLQETGKNVIELPVTPVSGQLPAMDRYLHNVQVSYRWFLGRVARSTVMMGMN